MYLDLYADIKMANCADKIELHHQAKFHFLMLFGYQLHSQNQIFLGDNYGFSTAWVLQNSFKTIKKEVLAIAKINGRN